MSTKDVQEQLAKNMKEWMKIETKSVTSTAKVLEKTDNPVVRTVMEIIQTDSSRHYQVQKLIAASVTSATTTLTPDELGDIWDLIEQHIELEKKTVELAEEALAALKGKKMVVAEYLLHYLLEDELKHNHLLEQMETIKKGMYPYG